MFFSKQAQITCFKIERKQIVKRNLTQKIDLYKITLGDLKLESGKNINEKKLTH